MSSASRSDGAPLTLHASCIALEGRALLITGASGRGKSSLALELMALGARLVADDRTDLTRQEGQVVAESPSAIKGLIEARGVGLLRADPAGPTPVALAVDLDLREQERLPPPRHIRLLGCDIPLLRGAEMPHLGPALLQLLKAGRQETT